MSCNRESHPMNDDEQILPEYLSDEAAVQIVELLYSLTQALENRYFGEIRRYYLDTNPRQPDLWD